MMLENKFDELTESEILVVDGGLVGIAAGALVAYVVYQDLKNCYTNGYNSVMANQ